ncbi:MAG: hypothetical protein KXJ49_06755 [Vulcanococcus sp.]|uniref:hypothetical protein n=1 Tax=Vulcanococcus sp. TaxID=2856995 RepID=UPI0025FD8215|nr:hypothetical protein [Vulcanococcus sp.]MBW0167178.1 hypothetical protein [Vulcanococcus sp.]
MSSPVLLLDDQPITADQLLGLLRRQGQIPSLVRELVLDQALATVELSPEEEEQHLQAFRSERQLENEEAFVGFLQASSLDEQLLCQMVTRPERVVRYREERWGPRANSLYLKHKERYDLVTYRRLQCANADVMQEVFFRLKDREESWESLAQQFAGGDPNATGRVGPVPVGSLEEPVLSALRQQGAGRVCRPISLGDQVVVAELEAFQPSEFNEELRTRILREEFETWLQEECSKMLNKVTYPA